MRVNLASIVRANGPAMFRRSADGRIRDNRPRPPAGIFVLVCIYESVLQDTEGEVTHTLLRGASYIKDNRLLPIGFDVGTAPADVAVYGGVSDDHDFVGGGDSVAYEVDIGRGAGPFSVSAELLYQAVWMKAALMRSAAVMLLSVAVLTACTESATVTGTVTYRERIALPETGVVVTVQLQDVSRADAPAIIIGEQVITDLGHQVPIAFDIKYDPSEIDERFTYAVRATITVDGKLMFTTTTHHGVITRGNPTEVKLMLEKVG